MAPNRYVLNSFREDFFSETDLVKMIVVTSFSAISLMMTAATPDSDGSLACHLLYCIPILLVALWFPRQAFRVTTLLIAGFVFVRVYLSVIGFTVDPVITGLHTMVFFWVFGATTLFSHDSPLIASRCRQVVEDTCAARFLCDPETLRLVCASRRCADMLGYAPPELVGIPAERFWMDDGNKARFIEAMTKEGYIGNTEMTFRTRDGDAHSVLLSCRALVPENLFECTVVDVGRLQGENNDLVRSNERLMELIQQSNDIFFMQDVTGRILHLSWSRASEHGISPDEIVGRGVEAFLPGDLVARHMEWVQKAVSERSNVRYDLDVPMNGSRHTFSVTIAPYIGADGSLTTIVGAARDITEMQRQRLACRQMSWEADLWKGIVTSLSHELRTPLQPLIGYLQLIVEDPGYYGLTEEAERLLRTCLACAAREQAVVERVVELSLLTMDRMDLTVQDIPLRHLVATAISDGGYDRTAQIYNEIPEETRIRGDPHRLSLAVESLVSNAVKYNEPPEKVWIRYAGSNENHYILVCDNGIGIPGDIIEAVFKPFYIGDTVRQGRKDGNAGPGLSIANKYVMLHGGEITVTSAVGEGSTFTIRIPREV